MSYFFHIRRGLTLLEDRFSSSWNIKVFRRSVLVVQFNFKKRRVHTLSLKHERYFEKQRYTLHVFQYHINK